MLVAAVEWKSLSPLAPWGFGWGFFLLSAGLLTALTLGTYLVRRSKPFSRTLTLLGLRLAALVLIFLLVWRPALATRDEEAVLPSEVFILLDASASMAVADEVGNLSRWDRAQDILKSPTVVSALERLARKKKTEVRFFQGTDKVEDLRPDAAPLGRKTNLAAWLDDLLGPRGSGRQLRAVIFLSDGIQNDGDLEAVLNKHKSSLVARYALGLGQENTTADHRDIALVDIKVQPEEVVPVKAKMTVTGEINAPGFINTRVNVRLMMEEQPGKGVMREVDSIEKFQLLKGEKNEVKLTCTAPDKPGEYKVEIVVDSVPGEVNAGNNRIVTYVPVEKGGVSVLWVEGVPRHETVFALRNALAKDSRFNVFYTLRPLGADPKGGKEDFYNFDGQVYDVIVIGDISAARFAGGRPEVFSRIDRLVKDGTGLLLLGGFESFAGGNWQASPLADLLPVQNLEKGALEKETRLRPTAAGLTHLLRLSDDPKRNAKFWGLDPDQLEKGKVVPSGDGDFGPLEGASRIGVIKPGATMLAQAEDGTPLMASHEIGKGRVLVFGGDTTHQAWIRDKETAAAYQRFWKQLLTWMARQEEGESNLRIKLDRRRVKAGGGEAVRVEVELLGSNKQPLQDSSFKAKVVSKTKEEFELTLFPLGADKTKYWGSFDKAREPDEYTIHVTGEGKDGKDLVKKKATARFVAHTEDLESVQVGAKHDILRKLVNDPSGGDVAGKEPAKKDSASKKRFFKADEAKLLDILKEISEANSPTQGQVNYWPQWSREPASENVGDQMEALWATPTLCVILFFILISTEWVLRRKWGMV